MVNRIISSVNISIFLFTVKICLTRFLLIFLLLLNSVFASSFFIIFISSRLQESNYSRFLYFILPFLFWSIITSSSTNGSCSTNSYSVITCSSLYSSKEFVFSIASGEVYWFESDRSERVLFGGEVFNRWFDEFWMYMTL